MHLTFLCCLQFGKDFRIVGVEAQANDLPCIFSDCITREIELLEKTKFISLDTDVTVWADEIIDKFKYTNRKNNMSLITDKNYNIEIESKKLQERYLQLYKGEKMRIGILTHHYINNFGAFLQAYSLQQAIKELHPEDDVYIINCVNIKHFIINTGGWFRFYRKKEKHSLLDSRRLNYLGHFPEPEKNI